jgi:ferredoxin-NADP reductase
MVNSSTSKHIVKIIETEYINYDVKRFVVEKPPGFTFIPGQSVNISINLPGWKTKRRPFSFTNLPDEDTLEFIIKIYRNHEGVTHKLESINAGKELILHDVFGVLQYQEKGIFIAAGTGITPFISIIRNLYNTKRLSNHKLIYSNKTFQDIILDQELTEKLGDNYIKKFTRENTIGFIEQRIDRNYLIAHILRFDQNFYVCGPQSFVTDISKYLFELGASANSIVIEE